MNCFEWQSRVSDFLDSALPKGELQAASDHLKQCPDCSERNKRYRLILGAISGQPRSTLPVPIRRSPFSAILPRLEVTTHPGATGMAARFPWWERIPWYLRIPLEGAGIVLVVLIGISAGPKLRQIYERRVEKNMSEFTDASISSGLDPGLPPAASLSAPLARGKTEAETEGDATGASATGDDFSASEGEGDSASSSDTVRAGKSEVWRFNLKTDSPHDFRAKIVRVLSDLGIPADTPGIGGIEAPGGIQFDLLVPQALIPEIKKQLEKAAPPPSADDADTPAVENFTWYKNQSKKPIPQGRSRVVIWLSQI